jgi:hypothetical protein
MGQTLGRGRVPPGWLAWLFAALFSLVTTAYRLMSGNIINWQNMVDSTTSCGVTMIPVQDGGHKAR